MLESKRLDKSVPIPLYFQLKNIILEEIEKNDFPVDTMIPTENELSDMFDISRTTVRQAITELVQEGKLYRIKSKGTFVARPKINQDFIKRVESYDESIRRTGRVPSTRLLDMKTVPATDEVAAALALSLGDKTIYISRLRSADGIPVVTVETYLPYDKCAFVLEHDLEKEALYSIFSLREETQIRRVCRVVEAVAANSKDAELLMIKRGKPVHFFHTTGFNGNSEPIEYSISRYRGDQNKFEVDVFVETGE